MLQANRKVLSLLAIIQKRAREKSCLANRKVLSLLAIGQKSCGLNVGMARLRNYQANYLNILLNVSCIMKIKFSFNLMFYCWNITVDYLICLS